jgi:formyl-CoA transferase
MSESPSGPLTGIRIVDWTQFGVGPFATSLLGAMGADVIHVEVPPKGDPQQFIPPTIDGIAALYLNYNTSKRSIHLDLRADEDRETMWALIESADVLVNNLRPNSVRRLGFDPESVLARNPSIVYCMSNGWGEDGPMVDKAGADNQVQAFGGWCSVMGEEGGPPEFLRFLGQIDLNASMYIVGAVLTGLALRSRYGGQSVSVSMLEATLAMQANRIAEYLASGVGPGPLGSAYSVVAPSQAFQCQDAAYVAVSAETERQWRRLCDAIGREDLLERPEFASNPERVGHRHELAAELEATFRTKPVAWWVQQLSDHLVPVARFWDFELIKWHPQVRENDHLIELDDGRFGTIFTGGPPWKFEEAPARVRRGPVSGEHTAEIRAELETLAAKGGKGANSTNGGRVRPSPPPGAPFEGLRVLELSTGIAGPYCGSLLADQGADVLKLEPPDGDHVRGWGPPFVDGAGAAFTALNRNKRIAPLPADAEPLSELVADADVVIVDAVDADGNPPPLDLRAVRAQQPRLIVCSVSAYGERGPFAGVPGSELTVQAMCNTTAGLGAIGQPPRRLGADQTMMNGGLAAYHGIAAALFRREQTGTGDRVEASALGGHHAVKGMHWTSLTHPQQWPGLHLSVWTDPPDHGIKTKDRPILLFLSKGVSIPATREQVSGLVEHFGGTMPEGLDVRAPHGTPGHPMHYSWKPFWSSLFKDTPWEEVSRVVQEYGCEITPWMDYEAFDSDPQIEFAQPFVPVEGSDGQRVVRLAWRIGALEAPLDYHAPREESQARWSEPAPVSQ